MKVTLNLTIQEAVHLQRLVAQDEKQQIAWIEAKHVTDGERAEARKQLVINRTLLRKFGE